MFNESNMFPCINTVFAFLYKTSEFSLSIDNILSKQEIASSYLHIACNAIPLLCRISILAGTIFRALSKKGIDCSYFPRVTNESALLNNASEFSGKYEQSI